MRNLIRLNLRVSGIHYILLFTALYHSVTLLSNTTSTITILSYTTTAIYAYIYLTVLLPQKNQLHNSFLLQRSLPTEAKAVIRGWYYSIYIFICLMGLINIMTIIIMESEYYLSNTLAMLLTIILLQLSFNIIAPSLVHTSSTIKKIISTIITILLYLGTTIVTGYLLKEHRLNIIIILTIISFIILIATHKLSIRCACRSLLSKYD